MTPAEVSDAVEAAVRAAADSGEFTVPAPLDVHVTCENGVYHTPVAVRIGAAAGVSPHRVADALAGSLATAPGVGAVEVTGPGFLAITPSAPAALVTAILRAGARYGRPPGEAGPPLEPPPGRAWPDRPRTFGNPGFTVRLAYARAVMIVRNARVLDVPPPDTINEMIMSDPSALADPCERALLGLLAELPGRADRAVRRRDPLPFMRHLERLAMAYHDVYERCPALPAGDQRPAASPHGVRCALAEAVRVALGNGLRLVGETPADRI